MSSFSKLYAFLSVMLPMYAKQYDPTQAKAALYHAYGAYCDASDIRDWSCKWCEQTALDSFTLHDDTFIKTGDLQAYMGYDDSTQSIVISFSGSLVGIQTWIDTFDAIQVVYPNARSVSHPFIVSQFYDTWLQLKQLNLVSNIQSMLALYPGSDILLTGHSFGAVLAQITALELKLVPENYLPQTNESTIASNSSNPSIGNVSVITFGSPRWCTKDLAQYFDSVIDTHWRIVNRHDIVPSIPYTYLSEYTYWHTATEIYYTYQTATNYTECNATGSHPEQCEYIGYSMADHETYMGVLRDCSVPIETTETPIAGPEIIYKFTKAATDGLSTISKIALVIGLAVGYLLSVLLCCCWCKARQDVKKALKKADSYMALS